MTLSFLQIYASGNGKGVSEKGEERGKERGEGRGERGGQGSLLKINDKGTK